MKAEDYTVGWICAVQTEYVAACEFIDEEHPPLSTRSLHDDNAYTLGRIEDHNVVIACLPKGRYGLTNAASVAKDMLRSFPLIRFGLMVGIGGGAPSEKHDIRLGDVVVSSPVGKTGGVIHYEFGKTVQGKKFERTGSLDAPPPFLLAALGKLSMLHERKGHRIAESVREMVTKNPRLRKKYQQPDSGSDRLYPATFVHADSSQDCQACCSAGAPQLTKRRLRDTYQGTPVIHYGLIASADRLMEDATVRDILAEEEDVLCFEREAAGLMDHFPCVVIRGICDYSDTHKNDIWQGYAAATAAAYAKELLCIIPGSKVVGTQSVCEVTILPHVLRWLNPISVEVTFKDSLSGMLDGSCEWLFKRQEYLDWLTTVAADGCSLLWITGIPGAGKTTLATRTIQQLLERHNVAYFYCDGKTADSRDITHILSTWTWQLLRQNQDKLERVAEIYSSGAPPNKENMKDCLEALLRAKPKRIVILDGLDECNAEARMTLCQILVSISSYAGVLVFSRELNDMSVALNRALDPQQLARLRISEADTQLDIKQFILREIKQLNLPGEEIENAVIEALQEGAQGMFQWADQMIKYLANGPWMFAEEYLEALKDLPEGLDDLYSRILKTLYGNVKFRSRSKQLLQWFACAQRPLTLSEIAAALKITVDQPRMPRVTVLDISGLKQAVSCCCGSLVRISDVDNGTAVVSLAHASIKDFLLSDGRIDEPSGSLHIDAEATHALIARSCLTYLCYEDIGFAPFTVEINPSGQLQDTWNTMSLKFANYLRSFPLLEYAALNWVSHFESSCIDLSGCQTLRRFYSSTKATIKWLQIYLRLRGDKRIFRSSPGLGDIIHIERLQKRLLDGGYEFGVWLDHLRGPQHGRFVRWNRFLNSGDANDFLPELHIAAFFDFGSFVEEELLRGVDVNLRSLEYQTPLCLAARGDSVASAKALLRAGADIDAKGWSENIALSWGIDVECYTSCTSSGPFEVVSVLLEAGANPNLTYGAETPLYRACGMPLVDDVFVLSVVALLLKHGATKYIDGHPRESPPLGLAAALGASQLVRLLLQHGANVDGGLLGDDFQRSQRYPLLLACVGKRVNLEVVQILLEAGANVKSAAFGGRTALHLSTRRTIQLTELLLRYGADVNVTAADGSLALHDAVHEGNVSAIRTLIEHGSSLDLEDETGRTPLVIAVENRYLQASQILIDAGAARESEHWEILHAKDDLYQVRFKEHIHWPQFPRDLFELYGLLRFKAAKSNLPRSVVLKIMDQARYWLKSTSSKVESIQVDEVDSRMDTPYLMSEPIRGRLKLPIREVKFIIRSHDQGWSDYPQHHGTYNGSCTWFDIAIHKRSGHWVDLGAESKHVVSNIHASSRTRQHCIIYRGRHVKSQPGWLDWIEPGDRIGIIPKAVFRGWINHVESVTIEIMTTCLDDESRS